MKKKKKKARKPPASVIAPPRRIYRRSTNLSTPRQTPDAGFGGEAVPK